MVLYFTSDVVSPPVTLFMGADKHESNILKNIAFKYLKNSIV